MQCRIQLSVAEVHPLKQGLKHKDFTGENMSLDVAEVHPLKQGLKPCLFPDLTMFFALVAEVHPLKQGLKLRDLIDVSFLALLLQRYIH